MNALKSVLALTCGVLAAGCSVPINDIPGTYDARYPFATSVLTLNRDGTFRQRIQLAGDSAAVASKGTWHFKSPGAISSSTYLELDSYLELANGFGKLNPAWRTPTTALMPVTRIVFWTVMGDGGGYGYRKRWK